MKQKPFLFSALLLLCFSGCAIKGYDGAAPSSGVATIYYEQQGRVSLQNMTVNGKPLDNFSYGISVLPGNSVAHTDYQMATGECPMYSIGCVDTVILGSCDINLNGLQGGEDYGIEIKSAGDATLVRVHTLNTDDSFGSGTCIPSKDEFHGSVMRRRSTIGK